jgi:hypothetical protein
MRLMASQLPASAPCVRTASNAKAEQLGVNRQRAAGPKMSDFAGEITRR